MVRSLLNIGLLWLLAAWGLGAQEAGLPEATRWRFDQRSLQAEPGSGEALPLSVRGTSTFVPGRRGHGLSLRNGQGPLNLPQAALGPGTWSLGFYARAQDLRQRTRLVAWGRAPLHFVDLLPDGRLEWGMEPRVPTHPPLQSLQRLGPQAWHHVALAVSQEETTLYLNGVRQGTLMAHSDPLASPLQLAPRGGAPAPFQGDVDEVVAVPFHTSEGAWAREEPYLVFRSIVLKDLQELGLIQRADELRAPTYEGTSRLRAYTHYLFAGESPNLQDIDPAAAKEGTTLEDYIFRSDKIAEFDSKASSGDLYLAVRSKQRFGYCGAASLILRGIYKAFGYEPFVYDFIHLNNKDSHVLLDVKIIESNDFVFQDPTYNIGGRSTTNDQVRYFNVNRLSKMMFRFSKYQNFQFDTIGLFPNKLEAPAWNINSLRKGFYFQYFFTLAGHVPPERR